MNKSYRPALSPREHLDQAIRRLTAQHGFAACHSVEACNVAGLALLLLTDDPQRVPEVLDSCVILPEALRELDVPGMQRLVAYPEPSAMLLTRMGLGRAPAVVLLRERVSIGAFSGIRDWATYRIEVERLLGKIVTVEAAI